MNTLKSYFFGSNPVLLFAVIVMLLSIKNCSGQIPQPTNELPKVNIEMAGKLPAGKLWGDTKTPPVWDWITAEEVSKFPTVGRIYIQTKAGVSAAGSGTFLFQEENKVAFLTAAHVIPSPPTVLALKDVEVFDDFGDVVIQFDDGQVRPATVLHTLVDPISDAAVLWMQMKDVPPIRLATIADKVDPKGRHVAMGYGMGPVLRAFNIQLKPWHSDFELYADQVLMKGDSGGPVFNAMGQQVGLLKHGWLTISNPAGRIEYVWPAGIVGYGILAKGKLAFEASLKVTASQILMEAIERGLQDGEGTRGQDPKPGCCLP